VKVAFLSWRDSTHPDGGGSEVFVEQVARELVARKHEVTLLCATTGQPRDDDLDGVHVHRMGGRLTVYPQGLLWTLRHRRDVDVVVDVINGLPFWTPLVRRRGVVALVHHVHERQWHIIYPGLRGHVGWFVESRVTPRIYRRVPHVTVSEASRRDLVALGVPESAISVARNGLDVLRVASPPSPEPRLCVLARLVPHKQIEHALALVHDLGDELPGLRLDIIGEGWWRPKLEEVARSLGVAGRVRFHGRIDAAERDRLLAEAWLMVLPSVKEGWGLSVLEAAAQGTPTLGYLSAGGVAESVLNEVTGRLVEDYVELRTETRRLLLDRQRREQLGRQAQARSAEFTWAETTDVVEKVLMQSLSGRRR
jgi:glycosyltransferase involved in cell wall biosynthesis